jgi:hypothetical protein
MDVWRSVKMSMPIWTWIAGHVASLYGLIMGSKVLLLMNVQGLKQISTTCKANKLPSPQPYMKQQRSSLVF